MATTLSGHRGNGVIIMSTKTNRAMVLRSAGAGEVLRVNTAFTELCGLEGDDLAKLPLLDWIHQEDRKKLKQILDAGTGHVLARHQTKRDDWISFDWRVKTHTEETVTLGLHHIGSSSSDRPQETSVPSRASTLAETLELMVRIVEAKADGLRCSILMVDEDGLHVSVGAGPSLPDEYNAAVEGLAIGPDVGSCGTAAFWNTPVIVEDIGKDPLWENLRETAAIAGVCACWSMPVTSAGGEVLGAMALYADKPSRPSQHQLDILEIAARMVGLAIEGDRLEEQLRQVAKMEAIGVLASGIAHDFNNLLAAIMGNAELAMKKLPADTKVDLMLQRIVSASVTATDLCSQMLTYSGRSSSLAEAMDCNALVRELGELLSVALSKKVELVYELHEAPLGVLADRSQLRQVVMNLITNASDAMGNRAGEVVISTGTRVYTYDELDQHHPNAALEPGEYLWVSVRDTGVGMSPQTRAKIFDPFFTTKPSGRGLGLAAVQGIVRGHRGGIAVESTPGVGTICTLLLPRVSLVGDLATAAADGVSVRQCGRILVVDDEQSVREVLEEILEHDGYNVVSACDGQEAVEIFRREGDSFDLVLLDLSMPRLDGEEAFQELRKMRSDVRVILSSGLAEQEMMHRFESAGLAGVVQKPVQIHVLLEKVASALKTGTSQ